MGEGIRGGERVRRGEGRREGGVMNWGGEVRGSRHAREGGGGEGRAAFRMRKTDSSRKDGRGRRGSFPLHCHPLPRHLAGVRCHFPVFLAYHGETSATTKPLTHVSPSQQLYQKYKQNRNSSGPRNNIRVASHATHAHR